MTRLAVRIALLALFLLGGLATVQEAGVRAQSPNGAGLVVRHGDGTLVYSYVEFAEEAISGEELLLRSGLEFVVAPFGGIGTAVCAINGEGCPAGDCFCESFSNPSVFWNYLAWAGSGWAIEARGPSARMLRDGDIDGWSWSGGEHGLPAITIDEIARITGFDRNPPTPAPAATPSATPTSPPVATEAQPPPPATSTLAPTEHPTATDTVVPTSTTSTSDNQAPTSTETFEASTVTSTATGPPTSTTAPTIRPAQTVAVQPPTATTEADRETATPGTGVVVVRPGGTPEPVPSAEADTSARRGIMMFGLFSAAAVAIGGGVFVFRRFGARS